MSRLAGVWAVLMCTALGCHGALPGPLSGPLAALSGALAGALSGAPTSSLTDLEFLFDRPAEPVFLPKADSRGRQVMFEVPATYLTSRYRGLMDSLLVRFRGDPEKRRSIPVRGLSGLDADILGPAGLPRHSPFSSFIPEHRKLAARLIQVFLAQPSPESLLSAALYARSRINPYMFVYALSAALLHRNDTRTVRLPPAAHIFPDKFVDGSVFSRAREEAYTVQDPTQREPLEIPMDFTATDLDEEHRVAYFREDVSINMNHWHWHLANPHDGPRSMVAKDRRGELFYYFHHQVLARYNFERFSNRLQRVKRFLDFREPIPEGYFPKLDNQIASRVYPARTANTPLRDIDRRTENIQLDIQDLERWRNRIFDAIHFGAVITEAGTRLNLTESSGIDTLGHIVESTVMSANRPLYGDLHNLMHVTISLVHDPDNRHLESFGVMGDPSTAMRDPVFYRWHAFVNDIFTEHKNRLPPYTPSQLDFPGVVVRRLEVLTKGARRRNELYTFWQQDDLDISRGLDFAPRGELFCRLTHLQHRRFAFTIQMENHGSSQKEGYVRLFLAPKFDERGEPMQFREQRNFMIELDKFHVTLRGRDNTVVRESLESSLTMPSERAFRRVAGDAGRGGDDVFPSRPPPDPEGPEDLRAEADDNLFCDCGWPQHMLIPKGTPEGLAAQLVVVVTDYTEDQVQQPVEMRPGECTKPLSFCLPRAPGSLYPDRRPMGFPFDRRGRPGVASLQDFLTDNMLVQDVVIRFTGAIEAPSNRSSAAGRRPDHDWVRDVEP